MKNNTIVFIVRNGYEIKTWIHVKEDSDITEMIDIAKKRFSEVGVQFTESDNFEFESF